ncbi:MAG: hypothetical protein DSZ10_02225 [Sulfurovum sp.]|nr:MAG: hypothetical protein DSZ10_02225 [Sulfurovum sp.]
MNEIRQYRNELILAAAFLIFLGALFYKYSQRDGNLSFAKSSQQELSSLKETIALKKVWGSPKNAQKVKRLKTIVPANKVKWHQEGKKLAATFSGLSGRELNTVVNKVMNLPVEIELLKIDKTGKTYQLECKCKS